MSVIPNDKIEQINLYNHTTDNISLFSSTQHVLAADTTAEETKNSTLIAVSPCRILITNRFLDSHVEVLESVARRYPLPWEKMQLGACGEQPEDPIRVDYYLPFPSSGVDSSKSFTGGWKRYFENSLKGLIQQRVVDGKYFVYHSIVDKIPDESFYNVQIEATCDGIRGFAERWLEEASSRFCVLHGPGFNGETISPELIPRTCHLHSYYNGTCWFLPIDFPTFERRKPNSTTPLVLCTPSKMGIRLLLSVLEKPPHLSDDFKIKLFSGNYMKVARPFQRHGLGHYLLPEIANRHDYINFQQQISQCDGVVSLIRPDFPGYSNYFRGTLTGSMALTVGHKLPLLIQSNFSRIYKSHFTAWHMEFGESEEFPQAFSAFMARLRTSTEGLQHASF